MKAINPVYLSISNLIKKIRKDPALIMSIGVFLFISASTILTLDQIQQRQITQSQAQANVDNQPGGACDLAVNNGCGGSGGCRHWEKCNSNYTCIDTTNGNTQPASSDACGNAALAPAQSTPVPQVTQGSNPTAVPAQFPSSVSCADMNWYCLGECATQEVKNFFGGNAAQWRKEKAINEHQPGVCDVVASQPTSAPIDYSTTSCYTRLNGQIASYPAGYCSPTSADSPYLFCNNTAQLTPNTSTNNYIGWVPDDEINTTCEVGTSRCIGNGFISSGGFNCCSNKTDTSGKCISESQTAVPPTATPTTIQPTTTITPTITLVPTVTFTPIPTFTPLPTNTPIPVTSGPTNTPKPLPTSTHTPTPTNSHTPTPTNTPTSTPSYTPTAVPPTSTPIIPTNTPRPPTSTPFIPTTTPSPSPVTSTPELCMPVIDRFLETVRKYKNSSYPLLKIKALLSRTNHSKLLTKMNKGFDQYIHGKEDILVNQYEIMDGPVEFIAVVRSLPDCHALQSCITWNIGAVESYQNGECATSPIPNDDLNRLINEMDLSLQHEIIHLNQFSNDPKFSNHYGGSNNINLLYRSLAEGVAYAEGHRTTENDALSRLNANNPETVVAYYLLRNWALQQSNPQAYMNFNLANKGYWDSFCKLREEYLKNPIPEYHNTVALLSAIGFQNIESDYTDSSEFTLQNCLDY